MIATRRRRRTLAFALTLALVPAAARGNDFDQFRIPEHRTFTWSASASGSSSWTNQRTTSDHAALGSSTGALGSRFFARRERDAGSHQIELDLDGSGLRTHRTDKLVLLSDRSMEEQRRVTQGQARVYAYGERFARGGWGHFVRVNASVRYSGDWYSRHDHTPTSTTMTDEWLGQRGLLAATTVNAGAGLELGRVRDATGVFDAKLLEARLQGAGALSHPLSAGAREKLAALMYARSDYAVSNDHPAALVWARIAEILREDGALTDAGIDPAVLMALTERHVGRGLSLTADRLPFAPFTRWRGNQLRLVFGGSSRHDSQRTRVTQSARLADGTLTASLRSDVRFPSDDDHAFGGVEFDSRRPWDDRTQLDAWGGAQRPLRREEHGFDVWLGSSAQRLLAERWVAGVTASYARQVVRTDGSPQYGTWGTGLGANLTYAVTDHVDATLQLSESYGHSDVTAYGGSSAQRSDGSGGGVSFQLNYRLAGLSAIPVLAPATPR